MSPTQQHLDAQHRADPSPSSWVVRFAALVAREARVLDLAAGRGRHARFFAARGAHVVAIDRDAAALEGYRSEPRIETRVADLENAVWPFASGEQFDAIVVVNYLHRPLFGPLRRALRGDGVLLYETFAMGNEVYGRPANPEFLLCADELLTVAALPPAPLTVVAFEQGVVVDTAGNRAVVQRIAAVGASRAWPPPLPL